MPSTNYRRGYRRASSQTAGPIARTNKRAGDCYRCDEEVPAGAGHLWRPTAGPWSPIHEPRRWTGSPVSGYYVGGCPDETDKLNEAGKFGGPDRPAERDRLASIAATWAATHPAEADELQPATSTRSGYTPTYRRRGYRGRCEDAPCCGCCD